MTFLCRFSKVARRSTSLRCFSNIVGDVPQEADSMEEEKRIRNMVAKQIRNKLSPCPDDDSFYPSKNLSLFRDEDMVPLSGVEKYVKGRKAIIQKPGQNAETSGMSSTYHWEMSFPSCDEWSNPLMGWTSSADPMQSMTLCFPTSDAAVRFAKQNGYDYSVVDVATTEGELDHDRSTYAHNFLPQPIENRLKGKNGAAYGVKEFQHSKGGNSHFCKTLKYHGDGLVAQHGGEASDN